LPLGRPLDGYLRTELAPARLIGFKPFPRRVAACHALHFRSSAFRSIL
jgi:hypothetical protein